MAESNNSQIFTSAAARIIKKSEDTTRRLGDAGVLRVTRTENGVRIYDRRNCEEYDRKTNGR